MCVHTCVHLSYTLHCRSIVLRHSGEQGDDVIERGW